MMAAKIPRPRPTASRPLVTVVPVFDAPFPPAVALAGARKPYAKRWDDTRLPGWIRGRTISFALSRAAQG